MRNVYIIRFFSFNLDKFKKILFYQKNDFSKIKCTKFSMENNENKQID